MRLRTWHAASAAVVAAFATLHIVNHLFALAGVSSYLRFMEAARSVYRSRVIEPVLLACVVFQVASGLTLFVRGWKQRHGGVAWLQAICGAYLAAFLLIHVAAVWFGRLVLELDTNFYFAAAGFHVPPFQLFFAPYYFLAVAALFTHIGCAAYWRVAQTKNRGLVVAVPLAAGIAVAALLVLALAGMLYPVDIPAEYKAVYAVR